MDEDAPSCIAEETLRDEDLAEVNEMLEDTGIENSLSIYPDWPYTLNS